MAALRLISDVRDLKCSSPNLPFAPNHQRSRRGGKLTFSATDKGMENIAKPEIHYSNFGCALPCLTVAFLLLSQQSQQVIDMLIWQEDRLVVPPERQCHFEQLGIAKALAQ